MFQVFTATATFCSGVFNTSYFVSMKVWTSALPSVPLELTCAVDPFNHSQGTRPAARLLSAGKGGPSETRGSCAMYFPLGYCFTERGNSYSWKYTSDPGEIFD